jgi:hypothetical protein
MTHTSRRRFAQALFVAGAGLPLLAQYKPADEEEQKRLAIALEELSKTTERLRAFKLANSDEPDFTFSALTDRW